MTRKSLVCGGLLLLGLGSSAALAYRVWPATVAVDPQGPVLAALQEDRLDEARRLLESNLPHWPLHAETRFQLARVCRRLDDLPNAELHLQAAAVLGWSPPAVTLEQQLLQAQTGKATTLAPRLLPLVESYHADRRLILEALTRGFLAAKEYPRGLQMAEYWVNSLPDDWLAHLYRGRFFQLIGQPGAIKEYEKVLELRPGEPRAQQWLAECAKKG